MTAPVWHEEISGMVKGPALFEGQQEWVRVEDYQIATQAKIGVDLQSLVADLIDEDYRNVMQHLRSSTEIDRLFQESATAIIHLSVECQRYKSMFEDAVKQHNEQMARSEKAEAALRAIIDRSHNDPLGTSKVIDMRKIAQEALNPKGEQQ